MIAIVFAVLTVIALPIIAIARAQSKSKELDVVKRELERLSTRIASLELSMVQQGQIGPKPLERTAQPLSDETPSTLRAETRVPHDQSSGANASKARDQQAYLDYVPPFTMVEEREPQTLEHHLGVSWLNRVGITMVVLGIAVFLVYHVSHFGPWVKITSGFAAAVALMLTGLRLEKNEKYRTLAYVSLGGAWAVAFVTTYAMHFFEATRVLNSEVLDLVLLLTISVGMITHALRYGSALLTGVAFMMAFSTVTFSQHDGYSLIANVLLAAALVFVCLHFDWPEVELAGMVAAYGNHVKWFATQTWDGPVVPHFWASATVLMLLFLTFRTGNLIRRPAGHAAQLERVFIPVLNTALWCALAAGPQAPTKLWAFAFLMVTCVVDLSFSLISRNADETSSRTLEALALAQLLIAMPFRFHGPALPAVWMLIGAALCLLALKRAKHVVSAIGLGVIGGSIGAIFTALSLEPARPHIEAECSIGLLVAGVLLWADSAWLCHRIPGVTSNHANAMYTGASFVASACVAAAAGLLFPEWRMLAAWSLFGAGVFGAGLLAKERRLHLGGLTLLLLAVAKLSAHDAWQFEPTARYLSLIGVGVTLLAVSFAYSRYTNRIKALL